jgi:hypothetical protein
MSKDKAPMDEDDEAVPVWTVDEWRGIVERQAYNNTFYVCFEDCMQMLAAYAALEAKLAECVAALEKIRDAQTGNTVEYDLATIVLAKVKK